MFHQCCRDNSSDRPECKETEFKWQTCFINVAGTIVQTGLNARRLSLNDRHVYEQNHALRCWHPVLCSLQTSILSVIRFPPMGEAGTKTQLNYDKPSVMTISSGESERVLSAYLFNWALNSFAFTPNYTDSTSH